MLSLVSRWLDDPSRVAAAIATLERRPGVETRLALYQTLHNAELRLAAPRLPSGWGGRDGIWIEELPRIGLLTSSTPDGEALLAFTNKIEVSRKRIGLASFSIGARPVLEFVLDQGLSGLLLNPAGPSAMIPSKDVRGILDSES